MLPGSTCYGLAGKDTDGVQAHQVQHATVFLGMSAEIVQLGATLQQYLRTVWLCFQSTMTYLQLDCLHQSPQPATLIGHDWPPWSCKQVLTSHSLEGTLDAPRSEPHSDAR